MSSPAKKTAARQPKCPFCGKPAAWENNPFRPFCSERCKNQDLAKWADGEYRIPTEEAPFSDEKDN